MLGNINYSLVYHFWLTKNCQTPFEEGKASGKAQKLFEQAFMTLKEIYPNFKIHKKNPNPPDSVFLFSVFFN